MTEFRDAFLAARRRIQVGDDPELVVPPLLDLAEAQEEIDLAVGLYGDEHGDGDGDG